MYKVEIHLQKGVSNHYFTTKEKAEHWLEAFGYYHILKSKIEKVNVFKMFWNLMFVKNHYI